MNRDLQELCAVSERTARRWRAAGTMPAKLAAWVSVALGGDLGAICPVWRGWRLQGGELFGGDLAVGFRPGEVLAIPYTRALVRSYQIDQRVAREPMQADLLSGKFEPAPELTIENDSQLYSRLAASGARRG